jgi:uncharacterized RDD family membrane protein YckC
MVLAMMVIRFLMPQAVQRAASGVVGAAGSDDLLRVGFALMLCFASHTTLAELLGGRSFGKLATGLWVVDVDGARSRPWRILLRGLARLLLIAVPVVVLDAALVCINPARQRLADLLGGTRVVARKPEPLREEDDQ